MEMCRQRSAHVANSHTHTLYVCLYLERRQPHFWYYNVAKKCVVLCPKTAVIVKF